VGSWRQLHLLTLLRWAHCMWALQEALTLVAAAASHNNEHIRRAQNTEKLMEIQASFEADTDINLFDSPSRIFIREGALIKQCRRGA
jgi:hypothetical protein